MNVRKIVFAFFAGAILCGGLIFLLSRSWGAKLQAELAAARWSLASATRTNAELADSIRQIRSELDKSNQLIETQQSIIAGQQSQLGDEQRFIDGIAQTIATSGGDIRKQIQGIADGFGQLYKIYYPGDE